MKETCQVAECPSCPIQSSPEALCVQESIIILDDNDMIARDDLGHVTRVHPLFSSLYNGVQKILGD